MKVSRDTITTIIGAVVAAGTAATPVLNATQGSMHQGDYIQLVTAVFLAVFGWFTNKPEKGVIQ